MLRAKRFAPASILRDLRKASFGTGAWVASPQSWCARVSMGTSLVLPHTLLESPLCSGCPEDVSWKEGFATAFSLPQKCLAWHTTCAFTCSPKAGQLWVLGWETREVRAGVCALRIGFCVLFSLPVLALSIRIKVMELAGADPLAACRLVLRPELRANFHKVPVT